MLSLRATLAPSKGITLATILGGAVPPVLAASLEAAYGSFAIGLLMAAFELLSVLCVFGLPEIRERSLRACVSAVS